MGKKIKNQTAVATMEFPTRSVQFVFGMRRLQRSMHAEDSSGFLVTFGGKNVYIAKANFKVGFSE